MIAGPLNEHSDGGTHRVWQIRLLEGGTAWHSWSLSDNPLLVGRSLGCQICVEDPAVSRKQCEFRLKDGVPLLVHCSRSTPTLVNGEVCKKKTLALGDVVQFASYRLIVDLSTTVSEPVGGDVESSPTTQSFEDSVYLAEGVQLPHGDRSSRYTSDMAALFCLLRSLAKYASLRDLVDELKTQLLRRLGPGEVWLARCGSSSADVVFFPPLAKEKLVLAPLHTITLAIASREGVLVPDDSGSETLCAPLCHGAGPFGAIAVTRATAQGTDSETDLHYLLAVVEGVSPLLLAAERMEQLVRDQENACLPPHGHQPMIGSSEAMKNLHRRIGEAAAAPGNVLILGETGVGKELAARMLHDQSARSRGPYTVVNCAAIPDELFESEVFGHEKGSYTGATGERAGLFEQAHGGTLFLDEVADLSPMNQARLLRVVETGSLRRLGSNDDVQVDVRIISATNRPLPDSSEKHMRIDLFYRLSSFSIWIPPLRERIDDIPEIANHFLSKFAPHSPKRPVALSAAASTKLQQYRWPGNIRELANTVERACYSARSDIISDDDILLARDPAGITNGGTQHSLDDVEREHLLRILAENGNNVARSAQSLGMAVSTLYYKLRRHKISLRNPN